MFDNSLKCSNTHDKMVCTECQTPTGPTTWPLEKSGCNTTDVTVCRHQDLVLTVQVEILSGDHSKQKNSHSSNEDRNGSEDFKLGHNSSIQVTTIEITPVWMSLNHPLGKG